MTYLTIALIYILIGITVADLSVYMLKKHRRPVLNQRQAWIGNFFFWPFTVPTAFIIFLIRKGRP